VTDAEWAAVLGASFDALRPGGLLVFESRDPAARAWLGWHRSETRRVVEAPGIGAVETWTEVTGVAPPLVSFTTTMVFDADGATLTSRSTLRFRERGEITDALVQHGFTVDDVREAPDRPGLEFVFLARRPDGSTPETDG
jgi:hypothetical protein